MSGYYDECGTTLSLTLNPPPRNPPISLILIFGDHNVTYQISKHLAQGIRYKHLDLPTRLHQLRTSGDKDRPKLGLLHPSALAMGIHISRTLLLPILKLWIDEEVALGARKFVLTGLGGDGVTIAQFSEKVVDPEAMIWIHQPGDYFDQNRGNIEYTFGKRAIMVPFMGTLEGVYVKLLGELYGRTVKRERDSDGDLVMQDQTVERVDSRLSMVGVANAALRTRL